MSMPSCDALRLIASKKSTAIAIKFGRSLATDNIWSSNSAWSSKRFKTSAVCGSFKRSTSDGFWREVFMDVS